MAEHGEWTRKGATLSDKTAKKEYGVDREFIVKGVRAGRLEYREVVMWGNPCIRLLRSQLEKYITEEFGADRLLYQKHKTELKKVKSQITSTKRKLKELETRRDELEKIMGTKE